MSSRARRLIKLVVLVFPFVGTLVLLAFFLAQPSVGPFAKYICSPMPKSVRVTLFKTNDPFSANPEPVCYLSFSATADDITSIVLQGRFVPAATNISVPVPPGPPGWKPADQLGPGSRIFTRVHKPAPSPRAMPLGRNRNWSEFLWVDETGTNAWFLLWGV